MRNILSKIKASYIFNILAMIIVVISIYTYAEFKNTRDKITKVYHDSNIEYVNNFTENLKRSVLKRVNKNVYTSLSENSELVDILEGELRLFVTKNYKYIYLLDKSRQGSIKYRFLLDGSINEEDKSELGEAYLPIEVEKFNSVYKNKKPIYFSHKKVESLWMTYLNPIIIDDEVRAILVVDFSLKNYEIMSDSFLLLDEIFVDSMWYFIIIFLIILWFSFIDTKREEEKKIAYTKLKEKTKELQIESTKVTNLNTTLEERIKTELTKNRQQDQQMIKQSRQAQMGEMLSMIAHQWRQPLAAISSTSLGLELKVTLNKIDNETILKLVRNITQYSQHLSTTIDDFRDFFKTGKEKEMVSYLEIVASVLNIIKTSINSQNIEILEELNCEDKFRTHPNELKQVILNLIKNAEDVLLEKKIQNAYIKIKTYKENKKYILEVSDNGGGIPEDIMDNIFNPYFSTKLNKNGTGLGLYMSRTIIEDHCDGSLEALNGHDGAIFRITLLDKNQ